MFTETRLRLRTHDLYCVPDVLVLEIPYKKGKAVTDVPAVVVEIKSPDDTFDEIVDRCFEYEKLAVLSILVMDPDNKRAWIFRQWQPGASHGHFAGLILPRQQLTIDFPFARMFAELDED